ncbi:MAG: GTP cyclohydrolase I FolE2 [Nitrososphaerales archaeon]|nr:GTP cyclohydrolase I FolE2 [Nitrososphaerales archaeon]
MADRESKLSETSSFIDTAADVQLEPANIAVNAGVANLRVLYRDGSLNMPVTLSIQTSTGLRRGVHMSRLVKAANDRKSQGMEEWLRWICGEVNKTQPGSEVTCAFELPFDDQFAKITMMATERGATTYQFTVQGMTACPCSKKMIGVGHMQRAEITLVTKSMKPLDAPVTVGRISECFSAAPKEEMKRVEEAKKILEAQANPRFAEDLVRECVRRFPTAIFVSGRCFESIHAHDAIASWSAKPGWMPKV